MNKQKVVVGLSGGVDSAVSAYLLKQQGYDVVGVFMQNWDSVANQENNFQSSFGVCDAQVDFEMAQKVADHLQIPLYRVDFIDEYWNDVFLYFLKEYESGRTPNPDILCNSQIKFDAFLKYALKTFNCDYIAMGHYAKVVHDNQHHQHYLKLCRDQNKDQTYFLCDLSVDQIKHVLFPLDKYYKEEVRQIAKEIGLVNFDKKDSTGICFIGERQLKTFLENYLPNKPGKIIDVVSKKVIGNHQGIMYYTLGQRKGLNLGGNDQRYFVCAKDVIHNLLYVAPHDQEDWYLKSNEAIIKNFNWQYPFNPDLPIYGRFRHRQPLQKVEVTLKDDHVIVKYPDQKNIVPGQYCVLYQNEICLGGGPIDFVIKASKMLN